MGEGGDGDGEAPTSAGRNKNILEHAAVTLLACFSHSSAGALLGAVRRLRRGLPSIRHVKL